MYLARLLTIAGVTIAAACGGNSTPTETGFGGGDPPASGSLVKVTIQDFSFTPAAVTIKAGTTVQWTNNGPSAHTTTSNTGVWDSRMLNPPGGGGGYGGGGSAGETFKFTFAQAGTYPYHCTNHPPSAYPNFTGTITVTQ